jgi:CheY-like chemotaxis protein
MDLNMPKKDGRQALAEIKADPDLREIPVIVWTTSDLDEDIKQCQEAGADTYITKPMSYQGLLKPSGNYARNGAVPLLILDSCGVPFIDGCLSA